MTTDEVKAFQAFTRIYRLGRKLAERGSTPEREQDYKEALLEHRGLVEHRAGLDKSTGLPPSR